MTERERDYVTMAWFFALMTFILLGIVAMNRDAQEAPSPAPSPEWSIPTPILENT